MIYFKVISQNLLEGHTKTTRIIEQRALANKSNLRYKQPS